MAKRSVQVKIFQASRDLDVAETLAAVEAKPADDRYLARSAGRKLYGEAFPRHKGLGLWSVHDSIDLDLHENGRMRPWDLTSEAANPSFFRFFPGGLVATLARGHGPSPSALTAWLDHTIDVDVDFMPVLRTGSGEYVASIDAANLVTIQLDRASIVPLREVDRSLGDAIAAMLDATAAGRLKVEIGGDDREQRHGMWGKVQPVLAEMLRTGAIDRFRTARVSLPSEGGVSEQLDLLKDRIAYHVPIEHAGLSPQQAFVVLKDGYDRFHEEHG